MSRWLLFFLFSVINIAIAKAQPALVTLDTLIKSLGNGIVKQPTGAGLSIGIYHAGQTWFYNFGTTERGADKPPAENTVYEIGSVTKTFVSLLLAQAVIDKKVKLDDDVRKYLDGDYPNLEYNHQPITLLNLANTTSGLPDVLPSAPEALLKNAPEDLIPFIVERYYQTLTEKDFYNALHTVKLDTIPGFYPKHSNCAAQLLGYILQRVYSKPLYQLLQQYILSPLQMQNTSFSGSSLKDEVINGYNSKGNPAPHLIQAYMQGSGGLRSSTADLIKYAAYLLDNKSPVTQLVLKQNIGIDAGTNKVVGINPPGTVDDKVYSASLNWWQYNPEKGKEQVWADGGTPGFNSYIVLYPGAKLAVVLISNKSSNDVFGALPGIAAQVLKVFLP